jgi:hypothetical protein
MSTSGLRKLLNIEGDTVEKEESRGASSQQMICLSAQSPRRTDADELAAPWSGAPDSQICEATAFLGLWRNQRETISPLK